MELFIESPCLVLEKLKIQIKDFYLIKDSFPKRIRQKKKKYLHHFLLYRLLKLNGLLLIIILRSPRQHAYLI